MCLHMGAGEAGATLRAASESCRLPTAAPAPLRRTLMICHLRGSTFQKPSSSPPFTITTLAMHCASSSVLGQVKSNPLSTYLFMSTMPADTTQ